MKFGKHEQLFRSLSFLSSRLNEELKIIIDGYFEHKDDDRPSSLFVALLNRCGAEFGSNDLAVFFYAQLALLDRFVGSGSDDIGEFYFGIDVLNLPYVYKDILRDFLDSAKQAGFGDDGAADSMHNTFQKNTAIATNVVHLKKYGSKAYLVSPDLEWALLPENTRLKGFPASHLKLPSETVYVSLPSSMTLNLATVSASPAGVYIMDNSDPSDDPLKRHWTITVMRHGDEVTELNGGLYGLGAIVTWNMELSDDSTVEECMRLTADRLFSEVIKEYDEHRMGQSFGRDVASQYAESLSDTVLKVFGYLMNVLLYVTSEDAEQEIYFESAEYRKLYARAMKARGDKRKKLFGRLKKVPGHKCVRLGKSFTVDRKLRAAMGGGTDAERSLSVRFVVAGHWRNQPHGPKGDIQYRKQWIKPYWKGPESAPLSKSYAVVK
jgi:hypothetical protein